jgi:hypothetical protein
VSESQQQTGLRTSRATLIAVTRVIAKPMIGPRCGRLNGGAWVSGYARQRTMALGGFQILATAVARQPTMDVLAMVTLVALMTGRSCHTEPKHGLGVRGVKDGTGAGRGRSRDRQSPARRVGVMTGVAGVQAQTGSLRRMLVPLALAQFICSFAGSNMNVMINDIKADLHTTVKAYKSASPCSCW